MSAARFVHTGPSGPAARLVVLVLVLALVATLTLTVAPAAAQETSEPPVATTLRPLPDDAGRIIKHPNYGHAPTHPGDRGGWQQTLVLLLVLGALVGGGALVWRDSARRRRPAAPPAGP